MRIYDKGHTAMVVGPVRTANAVQTLDKDRWVGGARSPDGYHKVYGTKDQVMEWAQRVGQTGDMTTELEHHVTA
jgi:hypothetical protein